MVNKFPRIMERTGKEQANQYLARCCLCPGMENVYDSIYDAHVKARRQRTYAEVEKEKEYIKTMLKYRNELDIKCPDADRKFLKIFKEFGWVFG